MVHVVGVLLEERPKRVGHVAEGHIVETNQVIDGDPLVLPDGCLVHCEMAECLENTVLPVDGDPSPLGDIMTNVRGVSRTGVNDGAQSLPAEDTLGSPDQLHTFEAKSEGSGSGSPVNVTIWDGDRSSILEKVLGYLILPHRGDQCRAFRGDLGEAALD